MNSAYEKELMKLGGDEDVKYSTEQHHGYPLIDTCGHGYLVVTKDDPNFNIAKKIVEYGYKGKLAFYLEEDCEAPEFLKKIGRF